MSFKDGVINDYFEWLYNYVCKGRTHATVSYRKMFECLHRIEFIFTNPRDENRAIDGIDLRYRFAMEINEEQADDILCYLEGSCSVLEMMVALSIRIEESIMDNTQYGNRTGQWFWDMIFNLGIGRMTDDIYNEEYLKERINIFLERRYEPNGRGGLFYIKDSIYDLRDIEIWSQLCWYLEKYA